MSEANTPDQFGMRLRAIMKKRGLTQRQLAKTLKTDESHVREWASGKYYPTCANVIKLCDVLGVSMDFLMLGEMK